MKTKSETMEETRVSGKPPSKPQNLQRDAYQALARLLSDDIRAFAHAAISGRAEAGATVLSLETKLRAVADRSRGAGITERNLSLIIPVVKQHRAPRSIDPTVAKVIYDMRRGGSPKPVIAKTIKRTSAWVGDYLRTHDDPAPIDLKTRELAVRRAFFEKLAARAKIELGG